MLWGIQVCCTRRESPFCCEWVIAAVECGLVAIKLRKLASHVRKEQPSWAFSLYNIWINCAVCHSGPLQLGWWMLATQTDDRLVQDGSKNDLKSQRWSKLQTKHRGWERDEMSKNTIMCWFWKRDRMFIIWQPPKGENDDYDNKNSWISGWSPSRRRK